MKPLRLPRLDDPKRYEGLYIFDFGDSVSVGYTAGEIEILLAEAEYRDGRVYRIYRAHDNGQLEITGIAKDMVSRQSGMVFSFDAMEPARDAFDRLRESAGTRRVPCNCQVRLGVCSDRPLPFCVAVVYDAESEDRIGKWMLDIDFQGGQVVEGGSKAIARCRSEWRQEDCCWLEGPAEQVSRSKREVLEAVKQPVQR